MFAQKHQNIPVRNPFRTHHDIQLNLIAPFFVIIVV